MKSHLPRRLAAGFTMLEIVVVMSIMVLIVGIGFASFSFLDDKDPFEEPAQKLVQMSKFSLNTAVIQHRGMIIAFDKKSFGVLGASSPEFGTCEVPEGMKMKIKRWGGRGWEDAEGQVWRFGEQGVCEPISVRFEDKEGGSREIKFHALTGGEVL